MVSFPTKDAQEQRVKPLNAISISVVELGTEVVNRVIEMMIEIVIRCSRTRRPYSWSVVVFRNLLARFSSDHESRHLKDKIQIC